MADGGLKMLYGTLPLTILDGTQLKDVDLTLPSPDVSVTGAQLLELAESKVSGSHFGLALPEDLKSVVLKRLGIADDVCNFRLKEFDRDNASSFLQNYVSIIADELKADPIVLAILDGKYLQTILDDEDDFAKLAEDLFTDLDPLNTGKFRKSQMDVVLSYMGIEMGVPPFSDFPQLSDIVKKHAAEGAEQLGLAQFAQILQPVLQELADALSKNHLRLVQDLKIINGSQLRKVLADEKHLNDVIKKISEEKLAQRDARTSKGVIRSFLEENAQDLGLPPFNPEDSVIGPLYNAVFDEVEDAKSTAGSENDFMVVLKEILEKFAVEFEVNPGLYDPITNFVQFRIHDDYD